MARGLKKKKKKKLHDNESAGFSASSPFIRYCAVGVRFSLVTDVRSKNVTWPGKIDHHCQLCRERRNTLATPGSHRVSSPVILTGSPLCPCLVTRKRDKKVENLWVVLVQHLHLHVERGSTLGYPR